MRFPWHVPAIIVFLASSNILAAVNNAPQWQGGRNAARESRAVQIEGTITDSDYPTLAILNEESGTVVVKFSIAETGLVTACETHMSSGSATLDTKSCEIVKTRFKYKPARNARGQAISETKVQRINWRLPGNRPIIEQIAPFVREVEVTVSPEGAVKECKVTKAEGWMKAAPNGMCSGFGTGQKFEPFAGKGDRRFIFRSSLEVEAPK